MIAVAIEENVPLINLNASSINLYNTLGPNVVNVCPFAYSSTDGTHFGIAGATQVARLVANEVLTDVPSLATYLTIPEPATMFVLALGAAVLTRKRR